MRTKLLISLAIVALMIVLLHLIGIYAGYYWTLWWWSTPVHILGGTCAGFFVAWFSAVQGRRTPVLLCVCAALLVGGAWEIFEYIESIGASPFMSYGLNTTKDLLNDSVGGFIAGLLVSRL
jgi:hypothetical protein